MPLFDDVGVHRAGVFSGDFPKPLNDASVGFVEVDGPVFQSDQIFGKPKVAVFRE